MSPSVRHVGEEQKAANREQQANGADSYNVLPEVTQLIEGGHEVVPLRPKSKKPFKTKWQDTKFTVDDFNADNNVGIKCGEFIDIDLDCPEARALAHLFLPVTARWEHKGSITHYLYESNYSCGTKNLDSPGMKKIIEFRSKCNLQTMVPPSVHPDTGLQLTWIDRHVQKIDGEELFLKAQQLTACSRIFREWEEGTRETLSMIVPNLLQKIGWSIEDAQAVLDVMIESDCDPEDEEKLRGMSEYVSTIEKKLGIPALRKIIGQEEANIVGSWLDVELPEEMEEPVDLWNIGGAPELPLDCLPPALRDRAVDVAQRISCALELTVFPGMSAIAFAAGSRPKIQMKANDCEWTEPSILYSFVAMASGSAKSPARKAMFKPIQDMQDEAEKAFMKELKYWEGLSKKEKAQEPMPQRKVMMTTDYTSEGLIREMRNNPQGIMLAPDELSGLLVGQNQYKKGGNDAQKLLEMYDGTAIGSTRKSAGASDYLSHTQVNVFGTIQPGILSVLYNPENINMGLVARFGLCAYPKRHQRREIDHPIDQDAEERWRTQLMRLQHAFRYSEADESGGIIFEPTEEGHMLLAKWRELHYEELEKTPEPFRAHLSKYAGLVGRIALQFHLCDMQFADNRVWDKEKSKNQTAKVIDASIPRDRIKVETVRNAITFVDEYLKTHAKRLYRSVDHVRGQELGRRIAAEIILEKAPETLTVRDVYRAGRAGMKDREKIAAALEYLELMSWGRFESKSKIVGSRGPKAKLFTVNRAVFDREWDTFE